MLGNRLLEFPAGNGGKGAGCWGPGNVGSPRGLLMGYGGMVSITAGGMIGFWELGEGAKGSRMREGEEKDRS